MRLTVRCSRVVSLCLIPLLPLLPLLAHPAYAEGERQLVQAINGYRAHPQRCVGRTASAMTPLALKSSLALPVGYDGGLRDGLKAAGYQAATVQAIQVAGARDVEAAFAMFKSDYCAARYPSDRYWCHSRRQSVADGTGAPLGRCSPD